MLVDPLKLSAAKKLQQKSVQARERPKFMRKQEIRSNGKCEFCGKQMMEVLSSNKEAYWCQSCLSAVPKLKTSR